LMTAIMTLMLGAFGLGAAMTDLGDQKEGLLAAKRVFAYIDSSKMDPLDGMSVDGVIPANGKITKIEFKNVSFSYPSRKNVQIFKNFNISVSEGEVLALVGPSGSGKSTIMSLLLRFYDPDEGEILIDGVNLKEINVRWMRNQLGYVGQEPKLFSGSIAENIKLGRLDTFTTKIDDFAVFLQNNPAGCLGMSLATVSPTPAKDYAQVSTKDDKAVDMEQKTRGGAGDGDVEMAVPSSAHIDQDILSACTLSQANQFINSFPNGYLTDISEGSVNISGGQKQRLAIARAIIKNPPVLLLDEATSALDATSEKLVQESIDSLNQTKMYTTIVIAHRLSTIRHATKIAVVEQGTVVEMGTHEELLHNNGLYSHLWMKQEDKTMNRGGSNKLLDKKREESLKVLGGMN
jgi:ATP-binding cassette, subfamily B (MDR/TAP), member 1